MAHKATGTIDTTLIDLEEVFEWPADDVDAADELNQSIEEMGGQPEDETDERNQIIRELDEQPAVTTVAIRICACGCGNPTRGGEFAIGHDSKLKGRLLAEARNRNAEARATLIGRSWASNESIDSTGGKTTDAQKRDRRRARLTTRIAVLNDPDSTYQI